MSDFYDIMLIGKRNGNFEHLKLFFDKDLLCGWELPFEYIKGCEPEYEEYFEKMNTFDYKEYRGAFKFDLIRNMPADVWAKATRVYNYPDKPESKAIDYEIKQSAWKALNDWVNLDDYAIRPDEATEKDIGIIVYKKLTRPADKGMWFTLSDLEAEKEKTYKELQDAHHKEGEWNYIEHSLEFKKLSKKERNHVEATYGNILNCYEDGDELVYYNEETTTEYLKDKYEGLSFIEGLYKAFAYDHDETWACVYSTGNHKEVE